MPVLQCMCTKELACIVCCAGMKGGKNQLITPGNTSYEITLFNQNTTRSMFVPASALCEGDAAVGDTCEWTMVRMHANGVLARCSGYIWYGCKEGVGISGGAGIFGIGALQPNAPSDQRDIHGGVLGAVPYCWWRDMRGQWAVQLADGNVHVQCWLRGGLMCHML